MLQFQRNWAVPRQLKVAKAGAPQKVPMMILLRSFECLSNYWDVAKATVCLPSIWPSRRAGVPFLGPKVGKLGYPVDDQVRRVGRTWHRGSNPNFEQVRHAGGKMCRHSLGQVSNDGVPSTSDRWGGGGDGSPLDWAKASLDRWRKTPHWGRSSRAVPVEQDIVAWVNP